MEDSQASSLLVRYSNLPPKKYRALKRLVEVGLVNGDHDIVVVALIEKEYQVTNQSLIRWKNQGLSLETISKSLSLRRYISHNLTSYGWGEESIVALNGFLEKVGSGLSIAYFINPNTRLPEISDVPNELVVILDTLLGVVAELPGTKFPLQRLLHIVNEYYSGNVRQAYSEAANDPEKFKQKIAPKQNHVPKTGLATRYLLGSETDEDEVYNDPEKFLRSLNKRSW